MKFPSAEGEMENERLQIWVVICGDYILIDNRIFGYHETFLTSISQNDS